MNLATQNYLVIGVVVAAFAVILPIFLKPYFAGNSNQHQTTQNSRPRRGERASHGGPRGHPGMEGMRDFPHGGMHGGRPPMGAPHPGMMADMASADKQGSTGGGGRGGIMSIALPIYSVGIVLYVLYVFYKFYTKGFSNNLDQRGQSGTGYSGTGSRRTGSTNTQPSLEQIQNYKHFLLAKEECAKRIAEERQQQLSGESSGNVGSDGNKLSGEQLTQLEMRLKEAEEAMERAMEKMGLDIGQLKQDTGYKDPLAQSLEELKRTMSNISSSSSQQTQNQQPSAFSQPPQYDQREANSNKAEPNLPSMQSDEVDTGEFAKVEELKANQDSEMKREPVIKFTPPAAEDELASDQKSEDVNGAESNSDPHSEDMDDSECISQLTSESNNSRRVSFAEGVDIIKQNTIDQSLSTADTIAASPLTSSPAPVSPSAPSTLPTQQSPETIGTVADNVNKEHPVTEPEGQYLGKPILTEDDSVDSPTAPKATSEDNS
ncbi:uncharacterized protein LOC142335950 [Convolutriloba macropyga]|uniref:uncharacterized protein LOC142335950 n=1 Tax=Convolutriloba macropyga TaxID=536237 RepID=UPI003F520943